MSTNGKKARGHGDGMVMVVNLTGVFEFEQIENQSLVSMRPTQRRLSEKGHLDQWPCLHFAPAAADSLGQLEE